MPRPSKNEEELDVDGVKVRLTNPDKVYFPKLGSDGTKRKLVEYYLAVASGPMLDRVCGIGRRICSAFPTASMARRSTRSEFRSTPRITWRPAW